MPKLSASTTSITTYDFQLFPWSPRSTGGKILSGLGAATVHAAIGAGSYLFGEYYLKGVFLQQALQNTIFTQQYDAKTLDWGFQKPGVFLGTFILAMNLLSLYAVIRKAATYIHAWNERRNDEHHGYTIIADPILSTSLEGMYDETSPTYNIKYQATRLRLKDKAWWARNIIKTVSLLAALYVLNVVIPATFAIDLIAVGVGVTQTEFLNFTIQEKILNDPAYQAEIFSVYSKLFDMLAVAAAATYVLAASYVHSTSVAPTKDIELEPEKQSATDITPTLKQ